MTAILKKKCYFLTKSSPNFFFKKGGLFCEHWVLIFFHVEELELQNNYLLLVLGFELIKSLMGQITK